MQSTSGAGTSDSISFKTGNAGAVTALTFNTLGQGTFGAATTASSAKGAISYGTLGYSDTNVLESLQTSVNSYAQLVLQNTSNGATASADSTISNDIGTASTNYANFGINSSGFTGTGSLSQPNNVYITSASSDLVLGTLGSNYIRFVVNSGATDAMTISPTGVVSIPNAEIVQTSLQTPLVTGGNTASSTLTLQSTSGAGTTDAIYLKTGNNGAVTALTLSTTGAASFANSVSATTVAATTSVTTPTIYGGSATSQALTFQSTTGVGATDSIVFKVGNNGATTALTIGTGTAGSLTFGGTAQRFLADFSNATALSRFAFISCLMDRQLRLLYKRRTLLIRQTPAKFLLQPTDRPTFSLFQALTALVLTSRYPFLTVVLVGLCLVPLVNSALVLLHRSAMAHRAKF